MFYVYAKKDGGRLERTGPEYTCEGPARQLARMLKDAGYTDVVIKQKYDNTNAKGDKLLTKTGRVSSSMRVVP